MTMMHDDDNDVMKLIKDETTPFLLKVIHKLHAWCAIIINLQDID